VCTATYVTGVASRAYYLTRTPCDVMMAVVFIYIRQRAGRRNRSTDWARVLLNRERWLA
jgi:hypothetical protein